MAISQALTLDSELQRELVVYMEKIKIILTGCNGRMGRNIVEAVEKSERYYIVAGVDINPAPINMSFPVFLKPSDYRGEADVIVDFSHHSAIDSLLLYAEERKIPLVVATTGHTSDEIEMIEEFSKKIPIFKSGNMSLGINVITDLAKKAAVILGGFDIEIIEKHHNQKLDAPSGTALMIADAISSAAVNKPEYIYDRHKEKKIRAENEIGIHSVRGGTIIGEHEIIFAGRNEVITISHSAESREMFANGALSAAWYMVKKPCGLYNMDNLIKDSDV